MAQSKLTFEQAMARLEALVAEIEEGKVSLEASIEKYADGIKLIRLCRSILDRAEEKIQVLGQGEDGRAEVVGEMDEADEAAGEGDETPRDDAS